MPEDFGPFLSYFAGWNPPLMVRQHGCLFLPDLFEFWDISFDTWCSGNSGGCFSYDRWISVPDRVSCFEEEALPN